MLKNAARELVVRSRALSGFRAAAAAVDGFLKRTALLPRWQRGGLVFMFHGVAEDPSPYRFDVSRAAFEAFCEAVAEGYDVLPLAELEDRRRAGSLPARAVAITFDDGYANNHDVAWPVLRKHGLPATVFVTTGAVSGARPLWFHRVAHILETTRPEAMPVTVGPWTFTLDTDSERVATVGRVSAELKKMQAARREEMIAALGEAFGVTDFSSLAREMLTWDQIRAMDAGGFTAEAHTVSHPILGAETLEAAAREIGESREVLSAELKRPVDLFAYPNGKSEDMTDDVVRAVEHAGFRAAFTAEFAAATTADDPYKVPRVTAYADTPNAQRLQIERSFYAR